MKKNKLVIFDADGLLFNVAWSFKNLLNPINVMACKKQVDKLITSILNTQKATHYIGFLGHPEHKNFRDKVATIRPYKGTRTSEEWQKFYIPKLKMHCAEKWGFYLMMYIEADDGVVIAHKQFEKDYDIMHIGEDKDLKGQIVGSRYNPKADKRDIQTWDEDYRIKHFWQQMLVGDNSDNIQGVTGVGPKAKSVAELWSIENITEEIAYNFVKVIYINVYKERALEYMIENYILLRMLDKPCFDYPKNVQLQSWTVNHRSIELEEFKI